MVAREIAKAGHPKGYPTTETCSRPASAQGHAHGKHSSNLGSEKSKWLQRHADKLVVVEFRSGSFIASSQLCTIASPDRFDISPPPPVSFELNVHVFLL